MDDQSLPPSADPGAAGRVAVIAVHGVADQQPGDTASAIAGLLANLETSAGRPAYTPFSRHSIRMPVRRVEVPPHVAEGQTFARRAAALRSARGSGPDVGFEFMTSVLAHYEIDGPDDTFDTVVLSGQRMGHGGEPAVDVYEMYWADLSRLTTGVFRIFAETYQLLFHVGSLGVHAVSAAQVSERDVGTPLLWSLWATTQRFAANAIALGVVLLNLMLFGIALMLVGESYLRPLAAPVSLAVSGLLLTAGTGAWTYWAYTRTARLPATAVVVFAVTVALSALAWATASPVQSPRIEDAVLATQLWLVVAFAIGMLARLYDAYRPGAASVALALGGCLSAAYLYELWIPPDTSATSAMLEAGAVACVVMALTWVSFFVTGWMAFLLGRALVFDAARRAPGSDRDTSDAQAQADRADRIRRTEWTARITLSLPAALFVAVTTVLWWAVWKIGGRHIDANLPNSWFFHQFVARLVDTTGAGFRSASEVIGGVIDTSAGWGFGVLLACVAAAGVLGLYALGPSVLAEVFPPSETRDGTPLGRWLDDGFRDWRLGGLLVWCGVLVVLPAGLVALIVLTPAHAAAWARLNVRMLMYVSAVLVPAGAGLMTFSDRFKSITLGLRSVIDAALDVDNHLREHPRTAAPRARIAARYASLLRHVYRQGYQKVVIIAHSQGTVITADLLRYITTLARGPHAAMVEDITPTPTRPIVLFTMGSPLRQLYGLRFPHLYRWARDERARPCEALLPLASTADPDPAALGVTQWVNAYRSGDYIGRYLWRPDRCAEAYAMPAAGLRQPWRIDDDLLPPISIDREPPTRAECCIGSGAHTHYWDRTAPTIGRLLDALIWRTDSLRAPRSDRASEPRRPESVNRRDAHATAIPESD